MTGCQMSFADLFRRVHGREWTPAEHRAFEALDREGRNDWVRRLAGETPAVRTEDRVGTDGAVYTAFWVATSR